MYPRRGHGPQFPQDYMPNRNFQEGGWDRPQQKWYPDGPRRDQFYNSRAHGDNFGQYRSSYQGRGWRRPRGDFPEKHHYHGHSYRGAKTSFTKGRYQHTSRSPYVKTVRDVPVRINSNSRIGSCMTALRDFLCSSRDSPGINCWVDGGSVVS